MISLKLYNAKPLHTIILTYYIHGLKTLLFSLNYGGGGGGGGGGESFHLP